MVATSYPKLCVHNRSRLLRTSEWRIVQETRSPFVVIAQIISRHLDLPLLNICGATQSLGVDYILRANVVRNEEMRILSWNHSKWSPLLFSWLNVSNSRACGCTNRLFSPFSTYTATVPLKPPDHRREYSLANSILQQAVSLTSVCALSQYLTTDFVPKARLRTQSAETVVLTRNLFEMALFWLQMRILTYISSLLMVILNPLSR